MYSPKAKRNLLFTYSFICGITILLWAMAKDSLSIILIFPLVSLVQLSGLLAVALLGLNFLLASRLKIFEELFGGLDKVYKQHRFTGEIAFLFMLAHPTLLLISVLNSPSLFRLYAFSFVGTALTYGKLALTWFAIIIIITLFVRLPYHIWRRIHQLMIVPLIFVSVHVLNTKSDVYFYAPLRFWLMGLLAVSITAYVYKVILYKFIGPKFNYEIQKIDIKGQIAELTLSPIKTRLQFEPGQFVFTIFKNKEIGAEEHPFSISSSPTDKDLRLSIKKSGDFTNKLSTSLIGEKVTLYGPYGQFGRRALATNKELVFVAGGIGVTPFLGITNYFSDQRLAKKLDMYYAVHNESEAVYEKELQEKINNLGTARFYTHLSELSGKLTAKTIAGKTDDITKKLIFLCGPRPMMLALTQQFIDMGVKQRNIVFEDFDLKG